MSFNTFLRLFLGKGWRHIGWVSEAVPKGIPYIRNSVEGRIVANWPIDGWASYDPWGPHCYKGTLSKYKAMCGVIYTDEDLSAIERDGVGVRYIAPEEW